MSRMKSLDEILQNKTRKTAKRHGMSMEDAMDKYGNPFGADTDTKRQAEADDGQPDDNPNSQAGGDDGGAASQDDDRYALPDEDDDSNSDPDTNAGSSDAGVIAEMAKLRNQLKAAMGRIGPEQQRNAALEAALVAERQRNEAQMQEMQRALDTANAQLEELRTKDISVEDLLTDEEKENIDPNLLGIIKKVSVALAKHVAPKTDVKGILEQEFAKREQQRVENYRNRILSNRNLPISKIQSLAQKDDFRAWVENNVDVKYGLSAFLNGKSTDDIDDAVSALNKRIGDYYDQQKRSKNRQPAGTDAVTASLQNAMRREPHKGRQLQQQEFDLVNRRIKELSRSPYGRSKAGQDELKQLLNSLSDFK